MLKLRVSPLNIYDRLKNNKTSFTHHHKRVDKDGYRAKNSTTCKSCANHNKRVISELYKKHGKDKP